MGNYLGDFVASSTIYHQFNTRSLTGDPITLTTPTYGVYKKGLPTYSTSGVTYSTDYNSVTGFHNVGINTGNVFYTANTDYSLCILSGYVANISVAGNVLAEFSIENRNNKVNVASIGNNTITSGAFATYSIGAAVIATGAITSAKFASGAITSTTFSAGAINSSVIGNGAIAGQSIGSCYSVNDVGNVAIVGAGAITSTSFATYSINAAVIATGAITSAKFASGAINSSAIAAIALNSSKFDDACFVYGVFGSNAMDANVISPDAVTKIQSGLAMATTALSNLVWTATTAKYLNATLSGLGGSSGLTTTLDVLLTNIATYTGQMHFIGDEIQAITGSVHIPYPAYIAYFKVNNLPISDVSMWVTSDNAGADSGVMVDGIYETNANGKVTFYLAPGDYWMHWIKTGEVKYGTEALSVT